MCIRDRVGTGSSYSAWRWFAWTACADWPVGHGQLRYLHAADERDFGRTGVRYGVDWRRLLEPASNAADNGAADANGGVG